MGETQKPGESVEQENEDRRGEERPADDGKVNPLAPPINVEPGS